jgi:serine/threonine-protein kinase RsbW
MINNSMSEPQWTWRCQRTIPSENGAGKQILDEILQELKVRQWFPHDLFGVHLALHEAMANAINHGNCCDSTKHIHINCLMSDDLLRVEISDEGPGFSPGKLPDCTDPDRIEKPCGRGVMLMKAFMSRVDFNERGNCVILEKHRADNNS